VTSIVASVVCFRDKRASIEKIDINKHQISFENCLETHQSHIDPTRVGFVGASRAGQRSKTEGLPTMAKAAKKVAKKAPAKKAAKKKK
jgi:hypothetical protein